jgi:hypothetical protein
VNAELRLNLTMLALLSELSTKFVATTVLNPRGLKREGVEKKIKFVNEFVNLIPKVPVNIKT